VLLICSIRVYSSGSARPNNRISVLFIPIHFQLMEPCLGELATRTHLLTRYKTALDQLCAPEELSTERLTKMVPSLEKVVELKIPRKRPDHPPARPVSLDNQGRVGKRKQDSTDAETVDEKKTRVV
jgi:hypothetical protein